MKITKNIMIVLCITLGLQAHKSKCYSNKTFFPTKLPGSNPRTWSPYPLKKINQNIFLSFENLSDYITTLKSLIKNPNFMKKNHEEKISFQYNLDNKITNNTLINIFKMLSIEEQEIVINDLKKGKEECIQLISGLNDILKGFQK